MEEWLRSVSFWIITIISIIWQQSKDAITILKDTCNLAFSHLYVLYMLHNWQ